MFRWYDLERNAYIEAYIEIIVYKSIHKKELADNKIRLVLILIPKPTL